MKKVSWAKENSEIRGGEWSPQRVGVVKERDYQETKQSWKKREGSITGWGQPVLAVGGVTEGGQGQES